MNTLENQLETAYAAVAKANEPTLAETPFRLSTLILAQSPEDNESDDSQASEGIEQVPVPYVLLTAKRGEESIPNTGIYETDLTIEVGDNAQSASADGGRLNALFAAASRPLLYKTVVKDDEEPPVTRTFAQALTNAVENFRCFGMPRRGEASEMTQVGSLVTRSISAKFLCQSDLS